MPERILRHLLKTLVVAYRWLIRPWLGQHCRFYPSCSEYALEALNAHGGCKGGWLSLRRLLRCHPWHEGGLDPVPPSCTCQSPQSDRLRKTPS